MKCSVDAPAGRHGVLRSARIGSALIAASVAMVPGASWAQTAPTTPPNVAVPAGADPVDAATPPAPPPATEGASSDEGSLLGDIVITAQKKNRAEQVQKVPIAVTALNAAQLDTLKVVTLRDIGAVAPNVALEPNGSARGVANFTIRGLGANSSIASVEPTVGTFINGIYQGVNGGVVLDAFDLESIEILRGPQGTLFGRNVTGGAVLVRTARPTDQFQAAFRGSVETGPQYTVAGTVGGPVIGDVVLAKLTGYYKNDRGYFDNRFTGEKNGEERTWFVRPTVVLDTHVGLTQTFIYEHLETDGDGIISRNILGNVPKFETTSNNKGLTRIRANSFTSETNVDTAFGNGVVTNLFGYRQLHTDTSSDLDGTPNTISHALGKVFQSQYSDELRYAGTFFDRWDLTVGVFFFGQDIRTFDRRNVGPPLAPAGFFTTGGGHIVQSSHAAFTQSDIRLTDTITATLGLRYSYETKRANVALTSGVRPCNFELETCNFNLAGAINAGRSWNALNPKLGLRWQIVPEVMLFSSYSQGVRSGGYNLRRASPVDPGVYDQEDQTTYELGLKSDLLDHRLRANFTGFYNKINDMQRDSNFPGPTGPVQILSNAVDAEVYGVEGEFVASPIRALQLTANFGYTKGKYTDVRLDLNGDRVINDADFALQIPRLSPWSYNFGATYNVDLGAGQVSAHTDYGYRSRSFGNEANTTFFVPYRNLNASLTYNAPGNAYSISLYGRNLTDHEQNGASLPIVANLSYYYTIQKGRQLGIELNSRF